jgi:hypothetical protein
MLIYAGKCTAHKIGTLQFRHASYSNYFNNVRVPQHTFNKFLYACFKISTNDKLRDTGWLGRC